MRRKLAPHEGFKLEWDFSKLSENDRLAAEALCLQFTLRFHWAEKPWKSVVPPFKRAVQAWGATCESVE